MNVLVCGSRDWADVWIVEVILEGLLVYTRERMEQGDGEPLRIIEGHARGADQIAHEWAERSEVVLDCFPADWDNHGKAAGPIRNSEMLKAGKPDLVFAFHDDLDYVSKGTRDMVERAVDKGVATFHIRSMSEGLVARMVNS